MLSINNLTVKYGQITAVREISFEVKKGEIACIVGPNGAGKSTTLLTISGVLKPSDGDINLDNNTINFVFHGGSGSSVDEIREAISYGAVKMNIDTDMQYAFMLGSRDYFSKNAQYLKSQIGNPDGDDIPNKKYYDPRVWLRKSEEAFVNRLEKAFRDLNNINTL